MTTAVPVLRQYRKSKSARSSVAALTPGVSRRRGGGVEDQLASVRRELDEVNRALYEAAQVQRRFCGPRSYRLGPYAFASEIFPVRHLSGDFILSLPLKNDLVFALGDIAGKGLAAGMWFTHVVGTIRRHMVTLGDPARVVSAVNRDLWLTGFEIPLTTLFVARLNLTSGELSYCNAGHPPAVLTGNSRAQELSFGGPILGSIAEAFFVNGTATLEPGDTLLAYSDGIAEGRNKAGVEFGTQGVLGAARAFASPEPSDMLFSVLAAVEQFVERHQHEDDIALLVLHRCGSGTLHA